METVMIETVQSKDTARNHGKFLVGRMDKGEWEYRSQVDPGRPLLSVCGWPGNFLWVMDLQTGEGIYVQPGGSARADLNRHQVWVCPMFEPFLEWLYTQDTTDIHSLRSLVELPDAEFSMQGYRREGPGQEPHAVLRNDLSEEQRAEAGEALLMEVADTSVRLHRDSAMVESVEGTGLVWDHQGAINGFAYYQSVRGQFALYLRQTRGPAGE